MTLPVKHGFGGQDWIKDVIGRPFVKTSARFKFMSCRSSELDNGILRILRACFLYSLI